MKMSTTYLPLKGSIYLVFTVHFSQGTAKTFVGIYGFTILKTETVNEKCAQRDLSL